MPQSDPSGQPGPMQPGDYVPSAPANVVHFKTDKVDLPSSLYIQRDDRLQFTVLSNVAGEVVQFKWRILLPNGVIVQGQDQITSDGSAAVFLRIKDLAEGFLVSAVAQATSATLRGQTFIQAVIIRGISPPANVAAVLFADYSTSNFAIGWPFGRTTYATEGPGNPVTITVANPAAGADWTAILLGASKFFKVLSFSATLVTGAAVANRIVQAQLKDGAGNVIATGQPNQVIPASTTANVSGSTSVSAASANNPNVMCPIPADAFQPGAILAVAPRFGVVTTNLQAADQWSNIQVGTLQWVQF